MSTQAPPSSSLAPTAPSTTTTTLEVERKFAPTPTSIRLLATNAGPAPFQSLVAQGRRQFQDVYYDTPAAHLSDAGVWLRRRGPVWEAKVRVGGNYTNSAFHEVTGVAAISALLRELVPGGGAVLDAVRGPQGGGLQQLAAFVSDRRTFLADGKFTVVLDSTDFGHVVGEVELERALAAKPEGEEGGEAGEVRASETSRADMIADMDREIDHFMKRYDWAFPAGKPVGKLSAYFALNRKG